MRRFEQPFSGIAIFVAAARAQSFTIAAEHLRITKSAVGKSIARLEERLGTKLFHRTTRQLALTVDGEAFFASCSSAMDEILAAENALTSRQQTPSGRLRIDMPAAYGRQVILPVLLDIAKQHPMLQMTMTFTDYLIDPIEDGVDLLIRFGEMKDSSGLVARKLTSQKQVICASPGYLQTHGTPCKLEDLRSHRCILGYRRGHSLGWNVIDEQGQPSRFTPPSTFEVGDGDAIITSAIGGLGICQIPASLVRQHIEQGTLVALLEDRSIGEINVHAVWPRTRHLLPKVRWVVDELVRRAERGALN